MFTRKFEIQPEPRLAFKLTLVLWLAVLSFVAPSTILLGQVEKIGDFLSLFSGTISALALAWVLYLSFKLLAGRPLWFGYVGVACAVLIVAVLQTVVDYAGQHAMNLFTEINLPSHKPRHVMAVMVVYFALYLCNAALFWTSFTQRQVREQELRAARAELRVTQAELARLRLQLDPHFMCNALNAIMGLIDSGRPETASTVAERLATFLRISLETHDLDEIPLGEELETLDAYIEVEEARFGDRLAVNLSCPDDLHAALVPSFILQPLVENALKHGASSDDRKTIVNIAMKREVDRLVMKVENLRASTDAAAVNERGIGLRNIRARLQLKFGDAAEFTAEPEGSSFCATIRLPWRSEALLAA